MIKTVYGIGGFCQDCDPSHDHPLNNIVEQVELPEPELSPVEQARQSAIQKFKVLGLTDEEIFSLINI